MKTPLLAATLTLLSFITFSQTVLETGIIPGPEWYQGSILLTNGKELQGLLKYSNKTDILSYENGAHSKSFTARNVLGFEFYDEIDNRQRVFYSLSFEDHKRNVKRPMFFEVVRTLEEFTLVSKIAPIKIDRREYSTPALFNPVTGSFAGGRYYGYPTTISHTETIFILSKNGELKPYLEITEKEIDGMLFDRSKSRNRVIDESALQSYISPFYKQLLTYARKNNLSFKQKDDLMKIMDYYGQLAKK